MSAKQQHFMCLEEIRWSTIYVIDIAWDRVFYEIYRHEHEGELPCCILHKTRGFLMLYVFYITTTPYLPCNNKNINWKELYDFYYTAITLTTGYKIIYNVPYVTGYILHCRGEELKYQAVVRDEMTQLETALLTTQRDYELLKVCNRHSMRLSVLWNIQAQSRAWVYCIKHEDISYYNYVFYITTTLTRRELYDFHYTLVTLTIVIIHTFYYYYR